MWQSLVQCILILNSQYRLSANDYLNDVKYITILENIIYDRWRVPMTGIPDKHINTLKWSRFALGTKTT